MWLKKRRRREIQGDSPSSSVPRTKEMEQGENPSLSEGKEIGKVAIQKERGETRDSVAYLPRTEAPQTKDAEKAESPPSEPGRIKKGVTLERRASLAAETFSSNHSESLRPGEGCLSTSRFGLGMWGGDRKRGRAHPFASLPTASYPEFEKKLEGMTSPQKAEPVAPQQVAPRAFRISPRAKEKESVGKGKEKEMGTTQGRPGRSYYGSHPPYQRVIVP